MEVSKDTWLEIQQLQENMVAYGYTFDVSPTRCLVSRFDEPIFAISDLNGSQPNDIKASLESHWNAALGAAMAHLRLYPDQKPKQYQGLDF